MNLAQSGVKVVTLFVYDSAVKAYFRSLCRCFKRKINCLFRTQKSILLPASHSNINKDAWSVGRKADASNCRCTPVHYLADLARRKLRSRPQITHGSRYMRRSHRRATKTLIHRRKIHRFSPHIRSCSTAANVRRFNDVARRQNLDTHAEI